MPNGVQNPFQRKNPFQQAQLRLRGPSPFIGGQKGPSALGGVRQQVTGGVQQQLGFEEDEARRRRLAQPFIQEFGEAFGIDPSQKLDKNQKRAFRAFQITQGLRADLEQRQAEEAVEAQRVFGGQIRRQVGAQEAQARGAFEQEAGRRGLAFSGVEQAGLQQVRAQAATAVVNTMGALNNKIFELQQTERAAFARGEFDFITRMIAIGNQQDFEFQLARFQAEVAADQQKTALFGEIAGGIGSVGSLAAFGAFG